jgi:hypothetical protein
VASALAEEKQPEGCGCLPTTTKLMRGGDAQLTVFVDVSNVKDLYLVVTCGGDNYDSDQAIWGNPILVDKDAKRIDMTTLKPTRHQVGWGKLFVNEDQNGGSLCIAGKPIEKGFWAHGPSYLHFKLDGKCTQFEAQVGIDTGAGTRGSVEFIVTNVEPEMPSAAEYGKNRGGKIQLNTPTQKAYDERLMESHGDVKPTEAAAEPTPAPRPK